MAGRIYDQNQTMERFNCSSGLNEDYRSRLTAHGLVVAGTDDYGQARLIELPGHPFFIITLFLPQLGGRNGEAHPLLRAFVRASEQFRVPRGY